MRFAVIILFALLVVVQLYSCSCGLEKLRRLTKLFLMPLLCLTYILFASSAEWLLIAGLLLGGLGDLLMLRQRRKRFVLGGMLSFGLGHICYMLAMARRFAFSPASPGRILWIAALYGAAMGAMFLFMRKRAPRSLLVPGLFYMLVLCALSGCALLCLLHTPMLNTALLYAGTLFFIASDTVLTLEVCQKKYGGSFPVMWTYLCAQTLIVAAFVL